MKLAGTCSLLKESHEKKKKKGLLFLGSGTPTFWLGLLLCIKRESRTPTFKILVRTLVSACIKGSLGVRDSQKLPWNFQKSMPGCLGLPTFKDVELFIAKILNEFMFYLA